MTIRNNTDLLGFDFFGTSSSESDDAPNYAVPIIAGTGVAIGVFMMLRNSPAVIRFVAQHCPKGLNLAPEALRSDPQFILSILPQMRLPKNESDTASAILLQQAEKTQEQELQQIASILENVSKNLQDDPDFILNILRRLKGNASYYRQIYQSILQKHPEKSKIDSEFLSVLLNLKKMQLSRLELYLKLFEYSSDHLRDDRDFVYAYLREIQEIFRPDRELFDSLRALPVLEDAHTATGLQLTLQITLYAFILDNVSVSLKDEKDFILDIFRAMPDANLFPSLLDCVSESIRENRDFILHLIHEVHYTKRDSVLYSQMLKYVIIAGFQNKIPFVTFLDFLDTLPKWAQDRIRNDYFKTIMTTHEKIRENPQGLLHQLFCCLIYTAALPKIGYEKSHVLEHGGPLRDFIAMLFESLCDPNATHCPGDYEENLLIPKLSFSTEPDNEESKQLFLLKAIGVVFGFAFLNKGHIKTGIHFHPVVFQLIHALTEDETKDIGFYFGNRSPEIMAEMEYKLTFLYLKHRYPLMFSEPGTSEKELDEAIDRFLVHGIIPPNLLDAGMNNVKEVLEMYSVDQVIYAVQTIAAQMGGIVSHEIPWREIVLQTTPETFADQIQGVLSKDQISFVFDPPNVKMEGFLFRWVEEASQEQFQKLARAINGSTTIAPGTSFFVHCYQSNDPNRLPTFHSCFGSMDLPTDYADYETFAERLNTSLLCLNAQDGFQGL